MSSMSVLKEARESYLQGNELMSKSCIKCRFSPSYIDAIPLLKSASEKFHGLQKYDEELCAREKLVTCFRNTKSYWEEGNEYDKIAQVQLKQLHHPEEAFNSMTNAHNAFVAQSEQPSSIKAITKLAREFLDANENDFATRAMKVAFDLIVQTYHVLVLNSEESHSYIYEAIDQYVEFLFIQKKINDIIDVSNQAIKIIESDGDEKEKQMVYRLNLIVCSVIEENSEAFKSTLEAANAIKEDKGYDDNGTIKCIQRIGDMIFNKTVDEKRMNNAIKELCLEVPASAGNLIKQTVNRVVNAVDKELIKKEDKEDVSTENDFK